MALSWNEIRSRAIDFQREWKDAEKENAETQSFYNAFFHVFGISRRRVASFEKPVKKIGNKSGRIDLFWKGVLLVEQKSKGRDLGKAHEQALGYFPGLKERELPKYILVCDFENFELEDLDTGKKIKFKLSEFHKNIEHFGFIAGYEKKSYADSAPVNIEASRLMGKLHDALATSGYNEHDLELFLVRVLFCLFAEDTGIFEKDLFKFFIEERTSEDGSDTGGKIAQLFDVLDTIEGKRQKTLDEHLTKFPYINGSLFERQTRIPAFDKKMRDALLECSYFNWAKISPAIFGSLFQSVSSDKKRRELGEHYTSEKNIMKTISPLFLDDLRAEFKKIGENKKQLQFFHEKLGNLTFFDPACGCGNFLILAYREIRKLEIAVVAILHKSKKDELIAEDLLKVNVDNFYGIEIDEFPAKIAEVALWLMDHQMNIEFGEKFGVWYARIPLKKSATILFGNSLTTDWKEFLPPKKCSYILGNPPFVGSKMQLKEQKKEVLTIFHGVKGAGVLDYVTAWYKKASIYIQGTKIKSAFVSTNSISQGEQAGILWNDLFLNHKIKIHFAHRTFSWDNEASGKAKVHCVIIGFGNFDIPKKRLFDYEDIKGESHENVVKNINPYLIDGTDIVVLSRNKAVSDILQMSFGNMPLDGGFLLFSDKEKNDFLKQEPKAKRYIKHFIGAKEFLNGGNRWCLWLVDISPKELKNMPFVVERVKKVKEFREGSKALSTRKIAITPSLFRDRNNPKTFIVFPRVSSEKRKYIPIGFFDAVSIPGDTSNIIPNATLYHFGILTSLMHNVWNKYTCGRLESRYRYSKSIVYNNFPWVEDITPAKKEKISKLAQNILDIRKSFADSSLADLYHPNTMPPKLAKAHSQLDSAVDKLYQSKPFQNERERIEFLFDLYNRITQPLIGGE